MRRFFERVQCADGFSMSVQAGSGMYCSPRDDDGPWTEVEVGFPSAKEPALKEYAEDPDAGLDKNGHVSTVYGWVPMETVLAIIESHGGQVGGELPIPGVPRLTRQNHNDSGKTEVAVLASPGFGAGWSTWRHGSDGEEEVLFHKSLVERVLAHKAGEDAGEYEADMVSILESIGVKDMYMGGLENLEVFWIEEGEEFVVNEYDGSESITLKSRYRWVRA